MTPQSWCPCGNHWHPEHTRYHRWAACLLCEHNHCCVTIKDGWSTLVLALKSASLKCLTVLFKHLISWRQAHVFQLYKSILMTVHVHATIGSFVPFCSAQDGVSPDMNCLVFWAHCENGIILMKHQVYNDFEWNDIINFIVSHLVVEFFICRITKIQLLTA